MDVALQEAPGVSTPYNWITDLGGAVDPNGTNSRQLSSTASAAFYFSLNTTYDTRLTADQNAATAMTFTQMGIMGGPLKHADGTANVGGVVTLYLGQVSYDNNPGQNPSIVAQTTVDLTTWVPGQFYWSAQLPNPLSFWGRIYSGPGIGVTNYYYIIYASCPVPYSVYQQRECTLRNGNQWGSGPANSWNLIPGNDHLMSGGVDLTLVNYVDLGTASLAPNVGFSGQVKRSSSLGPASPITPQILLKGHPRVLGVFDPSNLAVQPILAASSMAGGPLWKPSKLCTG